MSEELLFRTLRGFTLEDIDYLRENNYISIVTTDDSRYSYFNVHKAFTLDGNKLRKNSRVRVDNYIGEWQVWRTGRGN